LAKGPKDQARPFIERILTAIMFFALPLSIVGFIWSDRIIQLIYGMAYDPAVSIFRVMVASLVLTFSAVIINHIILAYNLQRRLVGYVILGAAINFCLNLYLVPRWGALGSATATLIALIITQGLIYLYLRMLLNINLIERNSKILLVSAITGLGLWWLHQLHISIYIALPTTGLFYFIVLLILREPLIEKVRTIFSGQH
jgi:O-antigen/teichoic acid export membrane protein